MTKSVRKNKQMGCAEAAANCTREVRLCQYSRPHGSRFTRSLPLPPTPVDNRGALVLDCEVLRLHNPYDSETSIRGRRLGGTSFSLEKVLARA